MRWYERNDAFCASIGPHVGLGTVPRCPRHKQEVCTGEMNPLRSIKDVRSAIKIVSRDGLLD